MMTQQQFGRRLAPVWLAVPAVLVAAIVLFTQMPLFSPSAEVPALFESLDELPGFHDNNHNGIPDAGDTISITYFYKDQSGTPKPISYDVAYNDKNVHIIDGLTFDILQSGYFVVVEQEHFPTEYVVGNRYNGKIFVGWNTKFRELAEAFTVFYDTNYIEGNEIDEYAVPLEPVFLADDELVQERSGAYTLKLFVPDGKGGYTDANKDMAVSFRYRWDYLTRKVSRVDEEKILIGSIDGYDVAAWNTDTENPEASFPAGADLWEYLVQLHAYEDFGGDAVYLYAQLKDSTASTTQPSGNDTAATTATTAAGGSVQAVIDSLDSSKVGGLRNGIAAFDSKFDKNTKNIAFYDIHLSDGSSAAATPVKVTIAYPSSIAKQYRDYDFKLYHQKTDGKVEEIKPLTVGKDGISFSSKTFSPYALTWTRKSGGEESPGTGDDFHAMPFVLAALTAVLTGGAVLLLHKKRRMVR